MKKSFQRVIATLNLFQGKQSLTIFMLAAIFALSACDDSSSASSNGPDENAAVDSSSSICKDCDDESSSSTKKIESSDNQSKDSSSDAKSNSSSSKKENVKNSSSSQKAGSSSSEFVFKLCEDGKQKIMISEIDTGYVTCRNNQWVVDSIVEVVKPKVYPNMDSVFGSEYVHGTFTDDRDKKVYKTANIYYDYDGVSTITVMAQNLNYAEITIDSTRKVFDDSKVEKRCYKDDPWYCDNYFGALYTWSEAMGLPKVCDSVGVAENPKCNIDLSKKVQGVCPTGWHVMDETEWKHIAYYNGIDMSYTLLSHAVWPQKKGHNSYGLSILPYGDEGYEDHQAYFWLPQEYKSNNKRGNYIAIAMVDNTVRFEISSGEKDAFMYIRCVLDYDNTFLK